MKKIAFVTSFLTLFIFSFTTVVRAQIYSGTIHSISGNYLGIGVPLPSATLHLKNFSQSFAGGNPAIPLLRFQSTDIQSLTTSYWDIRMDLGSQLAFWHHSNSNTSVKAFELGANYVAVHSKLKVGNYAEYGAGITPNGTQGHYLSLGLKQMGTSGAWQGSGTTLFTTSTGELQIMTNPIGTVSGTNDMANNVRMMIHHSGVSIDTTDLPSTYAFSVNGSAIFTKVVIRETNNWPDFVFAEDYSLRTLKEVETYIAQNGHLPEVPSAEEVQKEGVDVNEMNKILLQKVEELTLYLIQLEARMAQMEANQ